MKNFKIIILFLVITPILYAQKWEKINAPYTYQSLPHLSKSYPKLTKHDNIIYALPVSVSKRHILLYSTDDGTTWNTTDTTTFNLYVENVTTSYPEFTRTAIFCTVDFSLFRSDDKGRTWQHIDLSDISKRVEDATVSDYVADADNVVVRTRGGAIFSSTDNGRNWLKLPIPDDFTSGTIGIIGNFMIYEGRFTDGKYYESRFNKIPDIRNPVVERLSQDFPKLSPTDGDKEPGFYPCSKLSNIGGGLVCDGAAPILWNEQWDNGYPKAIFQADGLEYFETSVNKGIQTSRMYDTETPDAMFQIFTIYRKPDSAKVLRIMRLSTPYTDEFEKFTDDLIIEKSNPDYSQIIPYTIAQTESAVVLHTSTGYYRYKFNASSALQEESSATQMINVQPQPSKDGSTIQCKVPETGYYTITLIDPLGTEIRTIEKSVIINEGQTYSTFIESVNLSSGMYVINVRSDNVTMSSPLIVVK